MAWREWDPKSDQEQVLDVLTKELTQSQASEDDKDTALLIKRLHWFATYFPRHPRTAELLTQATTEQRPSRLRLMGFLLQGWSHRREIEALFLAAPRHVQTLHINAFAALVTKTKDEKSLREQAGLLCQWYQLPHELLRPNAIEASFSLLEEFEKRPIGGQRRQELEEQILRLLRYDPSPRLASAPIMSKHELHRELLELLGSGWGSLRAMRTLKRYTRRKDAPTWNKRLAEQARRLIAERLGQGGQLSFASEEGSAGQLSQVDEYGGDLSLTEES